MPGPSERGRGKWERGCVDTHIGSGRVHPVRHMRGSEWRRISVGGCAQEECGVGKWGFARAATCVLPAEFCRGGSNV